MARQASASGIPPRELFEKNPLPMWVFDLETLAFLAVNAAAVRHYGYSRREFLAMTIKEIRPPEDIPALLEKVSRPVNGYDAAGTWRHRKKDGSIIDVEITTQTLRFAGRKAELVLANDITERKRLEQDLHAAAEEWRKTFDAMGDAIALIDRDGMILRCNKSMTLLARKDYHEIVGRHCWEVVHGTSDRIPGFPVQEMLTTLKRTTATVRSGERIYKIVADPLFDTSGHFIGAVHIMSDVTEQKHADKILHDLVLQQEAILNNIPDIAWLKDDQGRFLAMNEPFSRACGFASADLVGKTDLDIWPRELAERYRADDAEVIRSGQRKVVEEPLADKEGKTSWIETIKTPIIDEQGKVVGTTGVARDITARRQSEEALKHKEHLLSEAQRIAHIGSWQADSVTGKYSWTDELHRIFGTNPETFEPSPDTFLRIVHHDDRRTVVEWLRSATAGESQDNVDFRVMRPDGAVRWVRGSVEPVFDATGRPIGARGTGQDITERIKNEAVLKASEKKFRTLFETANDAIFIVDFKGNFIDANTAAYERLGYAREELLSKNVAEIDLPEFAARVPERIKTIRDYGKASFETAHFKKDGTVMPVEINARVIDYEGRKVLYSIVRDITDRKAAETAIRESEERYRDLFENASDAIFLLDSRQRYLDANKKAEELTGYALDELRSKSAYDLVPPSQVARSTAEFKKLETPGSYEKFEGRLRRKNGEQIDIEVSSSAIVKDGKLAGSRDIVRDVTERKRTEAQLRDSRRLYERTLASLDEAVFIVKLETRLILDCNPATERIFGYSREELIGRSTGFLHVNDEMFAMFTEQMLPQIDEKGYAEFEFRMKRKNREVFPTEHFLRPLLDDEGNTLGVVSVVRDITARKKAEEAIAASEERYRNLFDNASDMIQSVAPDGHFLYVNAAWRKVLGYGEDELRSLTLFDIVHPSCMRSCQDHFTKAMSGEPIDFLEAKFVSKDGRVVDLEGSASVRRDGVRVVSTQVIFRDVTERRKLREEVFRISHDWEETFDTLTDMVTVHDKDFNIIRANKAAEKILGLPFLEVRNTKCFEYFHGTACPPAGCPSCASLVTGRPSVSEIYEPHLGRHLEIRAIPRLDSNNQVVGLIHVCRDISERKRNEEEIKRYDRDLAALNTASNTLMLITSLDGIYQEICNITFSLFDLKLVWFGVVEEGNRAVRPVAHAGGNGGYLRAIQVRWDDSPLGMGPTGMAVKTKIAVKANSSDPSFAPWREAAEKHGYVAALAVPLIQTRGECAGVLNFYSDNPDFFTPDKQRLCQIFANQSAIAVENALLIAGLEEKVFARTFELESANVELQHLNKELELRRLEAESSSQTKSDFLANMSHELRTPLNAIIGFSDLMVRGMAGPLAEQPKEYLGDILASGKHLLSLINDILDLSKVEAGKMEIEPAEYDAAELIDRSLVLFREKAAKHRLDLRAEIEGAIEPMFGDERKIRQVIYNLLSNAVKFTPDGGSVIVRARTVHDDGRDYAEISVSDTGIGISLEEQRRLFQPFSQLSHHLTKEHEGTGLGLALCKSFVEMHGGRIRVESDPGRGSTFTFRIPLRYEKGVL